MERIDVLREKISQKMSSYRLLHTLGVERTSRALGELYMPDSIDDLCIAALLHDITKECSTEEHIEILKRNGVNVTEDDLKSPKTLHAKTAEFEAAEYFGEFIDDRICQALRYHTTGNANMTVFDAIIYLADYIEETRTFDDCVELRRFFWSAEPHKMSQSERIKHLWKTVILSLDMTISDIEESGGYISRETLVARAVIAKKL